MSNGGIFLCLTSFSTFFLKTLVKKNRDNFPDFYICVSMTNSVAKIDYNHLDRSTISFLRMAWQLYPEGCALIQFALHFNGPFMVVNYSFTYGQPQPVTQLFSGETIPE